MAQPPPSDKSQIKKSLGSDDKFAKAIRGEVQLKDMYGLSSQEMLEVCSTGFSLYEQGQYARARVIFEGLRSLDPKEAYYSTALGAAHLADGNLDEAIAATTEALRVDPKELAAYVNRAEAYLRKGEPVLAAKDLSRALNLDPEGRDPLTRRAKALAAAALKSTGTTADEVGASHAAPNVSVPTSRPVQKSGAAAVPPRPAGKPAAPVAGSKVSPKR